MLPVDLVPTYEYECPKCPRVFEVKQRISEPALTPCDVCGGPIRRLLAPAPFILKGGGWYVTDYPSESRKKAISSESSGTPSSEAKSSTGDTGGSSGSGSGGESTSKSEPIKSKSEPTKPSKTD